MKKAIIAIVLVLLLGGGGGGYFMFMHGKGPKGPAPLEPSYLRLEPFVVPLMRGGAVDGYARIEVTLEITSLDAKTEVERHIPRLRNAILVDLIALLPLRRAGATGVQDLGFIKERIKAIAVKQYGSERIRDALIEDVVERPVKSAPPS